MAEKIKLDWTVWNSYVSDTTQCAKLPHKEEIKFLSSKDASLAAYLKQHPEVAHEMMVPSGFAQCRLRRYERYLGSSQPLSEQNGAAEAAKLKAKVFETLLPGSPLVLSNPKNAQEPTWREVNAFVCSNGTDTISGEAMAPEFLYADSGKKVRVINYLNDMKVEVTQEQWNLMWDHVVCGFIGPVQPADIEVSALHQLWHDLDKEDVKIKDWNFHGGQQVAILQQQLEHRLRAAHKYRPNPCAACCPFRTGIANIPLGDKVFLTKEEAAGVVIAARKKEGKGFNCCSYDEVVYKLLKKGGTQVPTDGLQWITAEELDKSVLETAKERAATGAIWKMMAGALRI